MNCGGCKTDKPESDFYKKANSRGRAWLCKPCELAIKREYYLQNRTRIIQSVKARADANPEERKQYDRNYFEMNRGKKRKYKREYMRRRLGADPEFRLLHLMRGRIRRALMYGYKKATGTAQIVGCSMQQLKTHLEAQFKPGMHWGNHGKDGWHIDHKRPCASFDLSKGDDQRACFHFSNLQPLWERENQEKSDKWQPT